MYIKKSMKNIFSSTQIEEANYINNTMQKRRYKNPHDTYTESLEIIQFNNN